MLTPEERQLLVIHLVRDIRTVQIADSRVTEGLFDSQTELFDLACWLVTRDNFRKFGQVIPKEFFCPAVKRRLDEDFPYHGLTQDQIDAAIALVFAFPDQQLSGQLIVPLLEQFLLTRQAQPLFRNVLEGHSYREIIEQLNGVLLSSTITSATPSDLGDLGIDVFAEEARILTGCTPVDKVLGGIRAGESIGLLGPMKGGKTSLCQSLACDFLKQAEGNRVTYVSYEENVRKQWPKFLICAMNRHHRKELEGKSAANISPEVILDLQRVHVYLQRGLNLIDMSGSVRGQGAGGVAELEVCLEELHTQGKLGQLVIIDHALPLVNMYMGMQGLDPSSHMRHQIQGLCTQFVSLVGRLNVTGVLAHQMDASGNKNPLRIPTHMDASECKHFAQYLHETMCLGVGDEHRVAWLNLSATRSSAPKAIKVKIAGWKCRVVLAKGYVEDEKTGNFMSTDEAENGRLATDEVTGKVPASSHTVATDDYPGVPGAAEVEE